MPERRELDPSAGLSLLELTIAGVLLCTMMLTVTLFSGRSVRRMREIANTASRGEQTASLLRRLERMLRGAVLVEPRAALAVDASRSTDVLYLSTLRGFPVRDSVLSIASTTADFEYASYSGKADGGAPQINVRIRGWGGGTTYAHPIGTAVRWWPLAVSVDPATRTDGSTSDLRGPLSFRGGGVGLVYQVPVQVPGVAQRDLGAVVGSTPVADGMNMIRFRPVRNVRESALRVDLNGDGDRADRFDVGSLMISTWREDDLNGAPNELALTAATFVQETGRWGHGDLDGDGEADPMFLWVRDREKVMINLGVLHDRGQVPQIEVLRSVALLGRAR